MASKLINPLLAALLITGCGHNAQYARENDVNRASDRHAVGSAISDAASSFGRAVKSGALAGALQNASDDAQSVRSGADRAVYGYDRSADYSRYASSSDDDDGDAEAENRPSSGTDAIDLPPVEVCMPAPRKRIGIHERTGLIMHESAESAGYIYKGQRVDHCPKVKPRKDTKSNSSAGTVVTK